MESVKHGKPALKADRMQKHKGGGRESRSGYRFTVVLPAILKVRLRRERVTSSRAPAPSYLQAAWRAAYRMSIWPPEWSSPAGPCAPTPSTSKANFTLPAFSNSRVTGTLSPCFSGLFKSNIIR